MHVDFYLFVYDSSKKLFTEFWMMLFENKLLFSPFLLSKMSAAADVAAVEQTISEMLFHTESRVTKDSD